MKAWSVSASDTQLKAALSSGLKGADSAQSSKVTLHPVLQLSVLALPYCNSCVGAELSKCDCCSGNRPRYLCSHANRIRCAKSSSTTVRLHQCSPQVSNLAGAVTAHICTCHPHAVLAKFLHSARSAIDTPSAACSITGLRPIDSSGMPCLACQCLVICTLSRKTKFDSSSKGFGEQIAASV